MLKYNIGESNWQSFTQQKHMATIEDYRVVLDNGELPIVTVQHYTVIQLASN